MANTPFLNLVKPTDTDQALIIDINNNSDKIDTGVSTLSEQIGDTFNLSTGHVTAIPSGSNLNNYTTPGVYSVANYGTATSITNIPTASAGRLIVSYGAAGSDYKRQIYIPYSSNDIFIRYNATSWSAWEQLAAGTQFNTVSISALADLQTYLDNMPTGKTSTLLLSGAASNAVCGSTYTCNVTVSKVDANFADLRWSRSNADAGYARYQKTSQTFLVEKLATKSDITVNETTGTYSTTAANVYEYTGISFTVPAYKIAICDLYSAWSSGRPLGLSVSESSTQKTGGRTFEGDGIQNTPAFFLPGYSNGRTYYLWVKRGSTGSNQYTIKHLLLDYNY